MYIYMFLGSTLFYNFHFTLLPNIAAECQHRLANN